ncbi:MAG TPA: amino acid adenylation domain-containing protein [Anaerolineales bacterium]|nr:amino acid adenylation domain-containing protein [Anaerolineales bacterium]
MDLAKRIAELSPEKRKLLLRQLEGQKTKKEPGPQPILRQNRETNTLPLSFSQQRLWFLDQLEPGNTAYNIPVAIRLIGVLDPAALEQSLTEIIQRHESLRTTFSTVDDLPVQVINPPVQLALPVIDLQTFSAEGQGAEVQRLISNEALEPFDLARGPLIRTSLLKLKEEEYIFLVTMHHIVSDAWSIGVFIQELKVLYEAFSSGKTSPLPEMPIQYADFAQWQQELLQGEVLEQQLAYWKKQLAPPLPVLDLPTDHPRPKIQTFNGAQQSSTLPESFSQRLRELSRQEGCTTFMVLLAAFNVLLARLTGQSDVIVGSPIAGRNREELENLIGFFINTVVLRTNLDGNPSFRELLKHVREVALEAYANQDIPFEKLLEELQPERDLSRTPIFQVFFNMLNFNVDSIDFSGLKGESVSRPDAESKFDLTFYISERDKQIQLVFVYNTDLFSQERMAEMLSQYSHLLTQIVADPDRKINHFSLITDQAKDILPDPAQALTSSAYEPVHSAFARQAMRVPDNIALIDQSGTWTYRELNTRSNQLANFLQDKGIQPHDVVAIYAHRSASLVWALLGILKADAAFVILDSAYPVQRLINYLQVVKPKGWIQLEEAGPLPKALQEFVEASPYRCNIQLPRTKSKADALLGDYSGDAPEVTVDPDDPAYIAFTSGSTGKPKGILGTHRPISHFMDWHASTFRLKETDRFSMLSGLAHDPLLRDIFTPLWLGATLCIPDQEQMLSPGQLSDWMNEQRISVAHLTPALQQVLAAAGPNIQGNSLPSLRYAFFGGEALTYLHIAGLKQLAPNVTCVNFYGATETPQAMSYIVPDVPSNPDSDHSTMLKQVVPLGHGIQDVQLLVLNASSELAGVGEVGEIHIRTPYLSQGYVEDEALTQQRFISNPFIQDPADKMYKTGDLGRYLPDGRVQYIGRNDQQVKIRGFRIELREIESALTEHSAIQQAVVSVWETETGDKRLAAYIVADPAQRPDFSELRSFLGTRLPDYMIPASFTRIDSIPLTPNGKVNRKGLPAPDMDTHRKDSFVAPETEVEKTIAQIWADVLRLQQVGIHDNFFELGGHSILATQVASRLRKAFQIDLPLRDLFMASTVAQTAELIDTVLWATRSHSNSSKLTLEEGEEIEL